MKDLIKYLVLTIIAGGAIPIILSQLTRKLRKQTNNDGCRNEGKKKKKGD